MLICENLAWDFGAFWKVNPATNRLNCAATWVSNTPHKQKERWDFEAVTRKLTFAPGEGLPGRIMETARPLWIPDLQLDKNFPRLQSALTGGLNAAIGFPILFKEQVLGVLEFFSETSQEPDENFMVMLAALGSQIGQFLNRKNTEEQIYQSELRLSSVLEAAVDAIIIRTFAWQGCKKC